jgi:hypothetical protein
LVTAYVVAVLGGLAVNYAGNKLCTIHAARTGTRWTEITAFVAVSSVVVAISSAGLAVDRSVFGLGRGLADDISANGVGLVLATAPAGCPAGTWYATGGRE